MARHHPPALFEPLEARQLLAAIAWDGGGDGTTINQAANWVGDVLPGASDDATINVAGSPTIDLTFGTFSVHSLTCAETFHFQGGTLTLAAASALSGPFTMDNGTVNGAGDLTISSTFNWTGGQIAGSGALILSASATTSLAGGSGTLGLNRNASNAGTVNWTSGNLGGYPGAAVTFTNTGTFNANPSATYALQANDTPNTFVNSGTFTMNGSNQANDSGFVFNSTGPINIAGGTLRLAAGGSMSGTITVGLGATVQHGGGTFDYSASAVLAGAGTWAFSGGTTNFAIPFAPAGPISATGGTVNLNAVNQSLANLTVGGTVFSGSGNLTITNSLNWSSGGFDGAGLLTIGAGATANLLGPSGMHVNRNITNAGVVNWTNGTLGFYPGPGVTFTNSGTFNANVAGDEFFYGNSTPSTWINNGIYNQSGPHNVYFSNCAFVNNSQASVNGGNLILQAGGGLGGTITIGAGAFITPLGGNFDDPAATFYGGGTLQYQGGVHNLTGTLTDNVNTTVVNTTIGGAGDMVIGAPFGWQSGTINGTGTTTVSNGITLTLDSFATKNLGRTLTNSGHIEHTVGYLQWTGNATLNNSAGHSYNLGDLANIYSMGSGNVMNNAGVFNSHSSQAPFFTGIFNSSGTLNIFTGTFSIDGGGTNSGVRNLAAGTTLTYHASYTHAAGSTTNGSGLLNLNGGTHTISGNWTLSSFGQILQGSITGPGNLTLNSPFSWGTGTISGPGSIIITANGKLALVTYADHILARNITNSGQLHFLNGNWHLNGSTITNNASGTIATLPAVMITVSGGVNAIYNAGTFRKMAGGSLTLDTNLGGIPFSNTGLVDVRNGTLSIHGPIAQLSAGTLSAGSYQVYPTGGIDLGSNSITTVGSGVSINLVGGNASFPALAGLTTNNGTMSFSLGGIFQVTPGSGTFTNNGVISLTPDRGFRVNGNFVQTGSGSTSFGLLSSTRFSRLQATGTMTLDGSATLNLAGGFVPSPGITFWFVSGASRTGQFSGTTLPSVPGATSSVVYSPTGATLSIA